MQHQWDTITVKTYITTDHKPSYNPANMLKLNNNFKNTRKNTFCELCTAYANITYEQIKLDVRN